MTTNGKTNPRVLEAQKAVDVAQRPLKELDERIAKMQAQLTAAQSEAQKLQTERDQAEGAMVEDWTPANVAALRELAGREAENAARVRGLSAKLATLQGQRPQLDAEYQRAMAALNDATFEDEFNHLDEELSKARYHLAQSQEQTVQRQKAVNELADRLRTLAAQRREGQWQQQRAQAAVNFRKANPNGAPGFERARQGF
jgi:chromosome segregation ATPase